MAGERVKLEVKERAFKAHEAESNNLRAAYLALDVARTYGYGLIEGLAAPIVSGTPVARN